MCSPRLRRLLYALPSLSVTRGDGFVLHGFLCPTCSPYFDPSQLDSVSNVLHVFVTFSVPPGCVFPAVLGFKTECDL